MRNVHNKQENIREMFKNNFTTMENEQQVTVQQRLISYIKFKGISVNKFEVLCGMSTGYVANMRKSIQPDKIMNIIHSFPDISVEWLLAGRGEMLRENPADGSKSTADTSTVDKLFEMLAKKDEVIAQKDAEINHWRSEAERLRIVILNSNDTEIKKEIAI